MSTSQATARTIARRLIAQRTLVLAGATAVLVVVGLIGVLTDEYGLAIACVLLVQAAIAGYLLTSPEGGGTSSGGGQGSVDRASARTLADISHARQSILDAIAQLDAKTK